MQELELFHLTMGILGPTMPSRPRAFAYLYANRNREAAESARWVIDSRMGFGLNKFMYVVEIARISRASG